MSRSITLFASSEVGLWLTSGGEDGDGVAATIEHIEIVLGVECNGGGISQLDFGIDGIADHIEENPLVIEDLYPAIAAVGYEDQSAG